MADLTQQQVEQGRKRLENLFLDRFYTIKTVKSSEGSQLYYCERDMVNFAAYVPGQAKFTDRQFRTKRDINYEIVYKPIIAAGNALSGLAVCGFATCVLDHLRAQEQDEAVITALEQLAFGITGRLRQGRELPVYFPAAYRTVLDSRPAALGFDLQNLPARSSQDLSKIVQRLEQEKAELRKGCAVSIVGTRQLARAGHACGLTKVFRFNGDSYCTTNPQTHQFRRDLEAASAYVLLEQPDS